MASPTCTSESTDVVIRTSRRDDGGSVRQCVTQFPSGGAGVGDPRPPSLRRPHVVASVRCGPREEVVDVPDPVRRVARALVDRPVLAAFTTLRPDGTPHTTPVWIARDGDVLLVNTAAGRVKARNVERDPRVAICVVDPDDPMNVLAVEGTVVEITTEGADELIDALSLKYTGNPTSVRTSRGAPASRSGSAATGCCCRTA